MPKGTNSEMRTCKKNDCRWPAAAVMTYSYRTSEVFLNDVGEPHPSGYDFCEHHANELTIPRGWTLRDERQPKEVIKELSADEIVEKANRLRTRVQRSKTPVASSGAPYQPDRYQSLYATLPDRHAGQYRQALPVQFQGVPSVDDLLAIDDLGHATTPHHTLDNVSHLHLAPSLYEADVELDGLDTDEPAAFASGNVGNIRHIDSAVYQQSQSERDETYAQADALLRSIYDDSVAPGEAASTGAPAGSSVGSSTGSVLGSSMDTPRLPIMTSGPLSRQAVTPDSQKQAEIVYPDVFKDLN